MAWRRDGTLAGIGRSPIPPASSANGRHEQDTEDWFLETIGRRKLRKLVRNLGGSNPCHLGPPESYGNVASATLRK